ncbi:MAG: DNA replication/repair protein RecF [Xanthomonadales bacterium]
MKINILQIENFRNLASVSLEPNPVLNFIVGNNGAGKTSILESIVVLSRGRSFRTAQAAELVGPVKPSFSVFTKIERESGKCDRLGLERSGKHWKARKNGRALLQISQLSRSLPLVLMEPNSHLLVSGTADVRRRFLDWGVFHVEQEFLEVSRRFSKTLRQRNAALRQRQIDVIDSIDDMLSPLGTKLGRLREAYSKSISRETQSIVSDLSPGLSDITLEYQNGWGSGTYSDALLKWRARDLERGATSRGPHRADLVLKRGSDFARAVLSRGEQKILSAALLLAQAGYLTLRGEPPVVLLDDLASEFDSVHFTRVLAKFLEINGQVWLTGTRQPEFSGPGTVFHVEHGAVHEMI